MNHKYKIASDVIGPRVEAFLSLYGIMDSKWQADLEAAINEILEADRAARPFAPDPRIAQLAELQKAAASYRAAREEYGAHEMVKNIRHWGEYKAHMHAIGLNVQSAGIAQDALLRRLASSPTIDPDSPPPQADPRAASEARRKEIQALASVEAGFDRMVHAIDQIGIEPPAEVSPAVETLAELRRLVRAREDAESELTKCQAFDLSETRAKEDLAEVVGQLNETLAAIAYPPTGAS